MARRNTRKCDFPFSCDICGREFYRSHPRARAKRCSPECELLAKRRNDLAAKRKAAKNPDWRAQRSAYVCKQIAAATDEKKARIAENKRRSRARLKDDPVRVEAQRAYQRDYARVRRAVIDLDPAAREARLAQLRERQREYQREYAKRRRAALTPEQRAEALAKRRAWAASRELENLLQIARKIDNDES